MLIDEYYDYITKNGLNKAIKIPEEMIIPDSEDEEGWFQWKPVKSSISKNEISSIESKYHIEIPKEYLNFIDYKQFLDIQIGDYFLYGINTLNTLEKMMIQFPKKLLLEGYFPIGYVNDGDYIVIDAKTRKIMQISFEKEKPIEEISENFDLFIQKLDRLLKSKWK